MYEKADNKNRIFFFHEYLKKFHLLSTFYLNKNVKLSQIKHLTFSIKLTFHKSE